MKQLLRLFNGLGWAVGGAYCLFLAVRLFRLIDFYSVNILWWDNFNYYFTLTGRWNYWQRFTAQLGPHREGVGMLLSSVIAPLTRWNSRAEAFAIGVILVLAMLTCLWMKARAFHNLAWYDLIIFPSLFFNARQYEIWCNTVNTSHSALPLFFVMLYGLGWTIQNRRARDAFILCVNFLGIFTGFSFFLGIVTPAIFTMTRNLRGVIISLASLALFFVHYKFDPANHTFRFFDPHIFMILYVLAAGFGNVFGFTDAAAHQLSGYFFITVFVLALAVQARGIRKGDAQSIIAASLIGFTILYLLATVEGRISFGLECLRVSRYVPLFTPGFVGAYLSIPKVGKKLGRIVLILVAVSLALYASAVVDSDEVQGMSYFKYDKLLWMAHYQQSGSLDEADAAVSMPLYPAPRPPDIPSKVQYLRDHRLNFFTLPMFTGAANPSMPPVQPGPPPSGSFPAQSQ